MSVRVIRTVGRATVRLDARTIQPRLDVAARPYPAPGMLRIARGSSVLALGILRPAERKSTAAEPFSQIGTTHRAGRNHTSILIARDRDTVHRPSRDESVKVVRRPRAAAVLQAI